MARKRSRRSRAPRAADESVTADMDQQETPSDHPSTETSDAPKKSRRRRNRSQAKPTETAGDLDQAAQPAAVDLAAQLEQTLRERIEAEVRAEVEAKLHRELIDRLEAQFREEISEKVAALTSGKVAAEKPVAKETAEEPPATSKKKSRRRRKKTTADRPTEAPKEASPQEKPSEEKPPREKRAQAPKEKQPETKTAPPAKPQLKKRPQRDQHRDFRWEVLVDDDDRADFIFDDDDDDDAIPTYGPRKTAAEMPEDYDEDQSSKSRHERPTAKKKTATKRPTKEQPAREAKPEREEPPKPPERPERVAPSAEEKPTPRKRPKRKRREEPTAPKPPESEPAKPQVPARRPDESAHVETAQPTKTRRTTRKMRPVAEGPVELREPTETPETTRVDEPIPVTQPLTDSPAAVGPFGEMELSETMFRALDEAGYLEPTPIQAGLIPLALSGTDVMGQARTGTGKTAAFGIPLVEQLRAAGKRGAPAAIILVPTRELAVQVRDECAKFARGRKLRVVAVYGGKPIRQQMDKLNRGVEIIVGTPGRVLDLLSRGAMTFSEVKHVVLDEADRMLDIGFRPDIEKILRQCPVDRQTLLLSATMPGPVVRLAQRYMRNPEQLNFSPKDVSVETIEQFYFTVDPQRKFDLLIELLKRENPTQAIIFCRTKRGTDRIHRHLQRHFPAAATIHGDLSQSIRDRVMRNFRDGKTQILVATDVVGRGIDVTSISHIINYDIPSFCDDYVHRVGRTGRMGREGVAYTFVTPEEGAELTRIEIRINRLLQRGEIEGFAATSKSQEEPARPPRQQLELEAAQTEAGKAPDVEKPKPVFGKSRQKRYRRAL